MGEAQLRFYSHEQAPTLMGPLWGAEHHPPPACRAGLGEPKEGPLTCLPRRGLSELASGGHGTRGLGLDRDRDDFQMARGRQAALRGHTGSSLRWGPRAQEPQPWSHETVVSGRGQEVQQRPGPRWRGDWAELSCTRNLGDTRPASSHPEEQAQLLDRDLSWGLVRQGAGSWVRPPPLTPEEPRRCWEQNHSGRAHPGPPPGPPLTGQGPGRGFHLDPPERGEPAGLSRGAGRGGQ